MDLDSWLGSDLPTWLSAIGTVGTLGVAVWVLKREQDDRRARDQDERRRQARLISVAEPRAAGGSSASDSEGRSVMAMRYAITVRNDSGETVSNLRIRWVGKAAGVGSDWRYDVAAEPGAPASWRREIARENRADSLRGGSRRVDQCGHEFRAALHGCGRSSLAPRRRARPS